MPIGRHLSTREIRNNTKWFSQCLFFEIVFSNLKCIFITIASHFFILNKKCFRSCLLSKLKKWNEKKRRISRRWWIIKCYISQEKWFIWEEAGLRLMAIKWRFQIYFASTPLWLVLHFRQVTSKTSNGFSSLWSGGFDIVYLYFNDYW